MKKIDFLDLTEIVFKVAVTAHTIGFMKNVILTFNDPTSNGSAFGTLVHVERVASSYLFSIQ